jgi:hypothetical protein
MSTTITLRGRRRIAHDLGVSERTISRWARRGLLDVFYESSACNRVMVLPLVDEANQRDRFARSRLGLPQRLAVA